MAKGNYNFMNVLVVLIKNLNTATSQMNNFIVISTHNHLDSPLTRYLFMNQDYPNGQTHMIQYPAQ